MGIKNTKPLIVTAIVLVAIVAFIVYQNQKDASPVQSKNNKQW
jgi:taurine transport system substrate-binding protein